MLCMECGAEMRLVEVAKADTMPVSGFEHRTWQCSGCSAVEKRMTFTREKTPTKTEPIEPTRTVLVEPIQTFQIAPAKSVPSEPTKQVQPEQAQPTQIAPLQPTQVVPIELTETAGLEQSQTVPEPTHTALNNAVRAEPAEQVQTDGTATVEPPQTIRRAHPEPAASLSQINARAKTLEEKVRNLKERVTAARKVADDTKRHTPLNRNWDEFRSVPPASEPSKAPNHINSNEPVLSPSEPVASPTPISDGESIARVSNTPPPKLRKTLSGLVRAIAAKGFSNR